MGEGLAPVPDAATLARLVVVGCSGSGKTTLAQRLARATGAPHVELDALHWGPDWQPRPPADFLRDTDAATAGERWVVDGNYRATRDIVWPRATAIVWLHLGFPTVFGRALRRTLRRVATGETLWAGNRETLRRTFATRESLLWWVLTSYRRRGREFAALRRSGEFPHLAWFEMRRPREVTRFVAGLTEGGSRR
ncbi:MAG: AAA family ATPase [Burkholderiales bacterium]